MVVCLRPMVFPFALAFVMPERTLVLIMANSSSANTADICMNAWLIGSIWPNGFVIDAANTSYGSSSALQL